MNTSREYYTTWQIRTTFFMLAIALSFAWAVNTAHADTGSSSGQVSIASSGQVIVKDAVVTAVYGDVIMVSSRWGAFSMNWTINTTGSTRFQPNATSTAALKLIKIGDTISFSGYLDTSASSPTVNATMVKDTAIQRESVTERGAVTGIDATKATVTLADGTTVFTNGGTILTLDGNYATLDQLAVGIEIEVIGSLNTKDHTLVAQRLSWKTPSQSVVPTRAGMISGFFSWLLGSRGALSILSR
ncbi:MAG: hypothetical protein JWM46_367 [Candidatus Kaiserbacteria bacterium]|nr:hypothetical protein [Candidatus Kaiserbacteria bacterium]